MDNNGEDDKTSDANNSASSKANEGSKMNITGVSAPQASGVADFSSIGNLVSLDKEREERQARLNRSDKREEDELNAIIEEINAKYVHVIHGGGNRPIAAFVYNEVVERKALTFIPIDEFFRAWGDRSVGKVAAGQFWIQQAERSKVEGIVFDPRYSKKDNDSKFNIIEIDGESYLNMWEGFAVEAAQVRGGWRRAQKHIHKILCNGDSLKFKYVIKWLAWMVQNPDKMAEVALVFKGEMGAGKGFLFSQFKKVFGPHGMAISNRNRLTGRFNAHLRNLCFLFCDEVYYPGDKEIEGVIKAMITEEFLDSEAKNKDPIAARNRLHIGMATNNEWIIPAGPNERRYFVELVNPMYAKNRCSESVRKAYFTRLWGEMDQGGREAMLFDLLKYDLKGWHPRDSVPDTEELKKQKTLTKTKQEREVLDALLSMIEERRLPYNADWKKAKVEYGVVGNELWKYLFGHTTSESVLRGYASKGGPILTALGVDKRQWSIKGVHKGKTVWVFPECAVVRAKWNEIYTSVNWHGNKERDEKNKVAKEAIGADIDEDENDYDEWVEVRSEY